MEPVRPWLGQPGVSRAVPVPEAAVANRDDGIHRLTRRRLDRTTDQPAGRSLDGAIWSTGVELDHLAAGSPSCVP